MVGIAILLSNLWIKFLSKTLILFLDFCASKNKIRFADFRFFKLVENRIKNKN